LKQRDPSGMKLSSDDMDLIARSPANPVRLQLAPNTGTYETMVEFEAVAGGRFALRIEGRTPTSVLPAIEEVRSENLPLEIRPRIFVEVIDAASRVKGRVTFLDYPGDTSWPPGPLGQAARAGLNRGGVGMPGDARSALTVGAASADGKAQPYSSIGAGPGRELLAKPDVLGFDHIDLGQGLKAGGSWVAGAFNAGLVACLIGADAPASSHHLLRLLETVPGGVLRVPATWLGATRP